MTRTIIGLLVLGVLLIDATNSLSVIDVTLKQKDIYVDASWTSYSFAVFTATLDGVLYDARGTVISELFNRLPRNENLPWAAGIPQIWASAPFGFQIECTEDSTVWRGINPRQLNREIPVDRLFPSLSFYDPVGSMLYILSPEGSSFVFPETLPNNSISGAIMLSANDETFWTMDDLLACRPRIAFGVAPPLPRIEQSSSESTHQTKQDRGLLRNPDFLYDERFVRVTAVSSIITEITYPTCNYIDFMKITALFEQYTQAVDSMESEGMFREVQYALPLLTSRDSFQACLELLNGFYEYQDRPVKILTKDCVYDEGTKDFAEDPCCNFTVSLTECCVESSITVDQTFLSSVKTGVIRNTCASPKWIIRMVSDFASSLNSQQGTQQRRQELQKLYTTLSSFTDTCRKAIYDGACEKDTDCYSNDCDTNGRCQIPWGNETIHLIQCFGDYMPEEVQLEFLHGFNATDSKDPASLLIDRFGIPDCVGPDSESCRAQVEDEEDEYGNIEGRRIIAGNETGCLEPKSCNYDDSLNEDECLRNPLLGENYCAICSGLNCREVSRPDRCMFSLIRSYDDCVSTTGRVWAYVDGKYGCFLPGIKSKIECLPPTICGQDGDATCAAPFCYRMLSDTILNKPGHCASLSVSLAGSNFYWDTTMGTNGLCITRWPYDEPANQIACDEFRSLYYPGYLWQPGQFDSLRSCQGGFCSNDYYNATSRMWQTVSAANCNTEMGYGCTLPCTRCVGQNDYDLSSACVNTTVYDEIECRGLPTRSVPIPDRFNKGVTCVLLDYRNATACNLNRDLRWVDCEANTDEESCSESVELECAWVHNARCRNKKECEAAGQCNDWELFGTTRLTRGSGSQGSEGRCLVPDRLDERGNYQWCNWEGYSQISQSSFPLHCYNDLLDYEAYCTELEGEWKTKATTEVECLTQGYACSNLGTDVLTTDYSRYECTQCSGQYSSIFQWTTGKWIPGEVNSLQWNQRSYESVNRWQKTVNPEVLYDVVNRAIAVVIGREFMRMVNKDFGATMHLLRLVSCTCGADKNRTIAQGIDCFEDLKRTGFYASKISSTTSFRGRRTTIDAESASVSICPSCVHDNTDVAVYKVFPFSIMEEEDNYEVVQDDTGKIIGQIISDGIRIESDEDLKEFILSISQRDDIPRKSQYTKPAFVRFNENGRRADGSKGTLMPYTYTVSKSDSGDTSGTASSSGVYFAALLSSSEDGNFWSSQNTGIIAGTGALFGIVVVVMVVAIVLILFRKRISWLVKGKEFRRDSYSADGVSREGNINFSIDYKDEEEVLLEESRRQPEQDLEIYNDN